MENLPKVLVVGINAWKDNTGINTLINLFSCWDKDKLAHVYATDSLPNTKICDNFFRISEKKVIKSLYKWNLVTGEQVYNTENKVSSSGKLAGKHSVLLTWAREFVWKFGRWKHNDLLKFINDFNPDVICMPLYSSIYMNRLQLYIAKKTKKPIFIYASDDNYTYKTVGKNPLSLIHRLIVRRKIRKLMTYQKGFFVIAPKQKEEYDKIFNIDSKILTKGIDFSNVCQNKNEVNSPIKMVYTGKLIIGRDGSLIKIANALGKINKDETKITLDIYTTDVLTKTQSELLNRNGCLVKGSLTLDEVINVQKESDILVFVESLEKKYKNMARLSFSTKITDYLKSGKCIFAVGDKCIAPIDYFTKYNSAVVATSEEEIFTKLNELVTNNDLILQYGERAFICGKEHHDKIKQDKLLIDSIKEIAKS